MNTKLGVLFFVGVIALASMGVSYAGDNYTAFIECDSWDEEGKNIGSVNAYIIETGDLIISVSNAYPDYKAFVSFTIQHTGNPDDPRMYLKLIDLDYPSSIMDIVVTDTDGDPIPINTYIDPGDTLEGLLTISILDGIDEDMTYEFGVDFQFSDEPPAP